jgi:hypothetical protein
VQRWFDAIHAPLPLACPCKKKHKMSISKLTDLQLSPLSQYQGWVRSNPMTEPPVDLQGSKAVATPVVPKMAHPRTQLHAIQR